MENKIQPANISSPKKPLLLLAGPTATGKTSLALTLAQSGKAEIISADSMQVYQGCAVGSAQPTPEETGPIPYHLIHCIPPSQAFSVADWLHRAQALIREIQGRGKRVIITGGTGLYFKALTEGLFRGPGVGRNPACRQKLEREWEDDGGAALWSRLEKEDPLSAAKLHPHDKIRVVRALEVLETTGKSIRQWQSEQKEDYQPPPAWRFVLRGPRPWLYERINRRVGLMLEAGFEAEVARLVEEGAQPDWPALKALGYKQLWEYQRGEKSREEAVEETCRLSRRFAKEQMILFRRWPGACWLDARRGREENRDFIEKMLVFPPPSIL